MITLISSKNLGVYRNMRHTVVSAVVLFNDGHHIWEVVERTYNLGKKVLKRLKYANDGYSEL